MQMGGGGFVRDKLFLVWEFRKKRFSHRGTEAQRERGTEEIMAKIWIFAFRLLCFVPSVPLCLCVKMVLTALCLVLLLTNPQNPRNP